MSLTRLESVNAANNAITNIAALAGHTALRELNLSGNPLASVDAISGMTNLTTLISTAPAWTTETCPRCTR